MCTSHYNQIELHLSEMRLIQVLYSLILHACQGELYCGGSDINIMCRQMQSCRDDLLPGNSGWSLW